MGILGRAYGSIWASGGVASVFALFSRVTEDEALRHQRRDNKHRLASTQPDIHLQALGTELGLGVGVLMHHLHTLSRTGHGRGVKCAGRVPWFPIDWSMRRARCCRLAAERDPGAASFLAAVEVEPGTTLSRILDVTGQNMPQVSRVGIRLADVGLLRKRRDSRTVRFFPVES